jgi:hypothetical protein
VVADSWRGEIEPQLLQKGVACLGPFVLEHAEATADRGL